MSLPKKRLVATRAGDGHIRVAEEDAPELVPGAVLVDVRVSLISPGTELGGWRGMKAKREAPDPNAKPAGFGYSNAGVVVAAGEGVEQFEPGDRVACIGGGASHTNIAVVGQNLCTRLPEDVTFAQGSYAMLGATALNALRRGDPAFGEFVAVAGLGIIGQIVAQLYRLAGCYVTGWDAIPFRTQLAEKCGAAQAVVVGEEDEVERTKAFAGGYGLDQAVVAFGADANKAIESIGRCMKRSPDGHPMGTIVVVGNPQFQYRSHESAGMSNIDIRRSSRTGPGFLDHDWEFGSDYPGVFVRWTTRTNVELCLRLIGEGRLDVDSLTTHTVPLLNVDEGTSALLSDPDSVLGVVLAMPD